MVLWRLSQILVFLLVYLFPFCSILKLSSCTFFFLPTRIYPPPLSPRSPTHIFLHCLTMPSFLKFLDPFHFSPSLSHPHPISLCLHIACFHLSIIAFPHLFISLVHFPPNLSFSLPFHPSILLSLIYRLYLSHRICLFYLHPLHLNTFILVFPCLHGSYLSTPYLLSQSYQGKGVSKSVSMNCGPCQGMPLGLSHSDSYTWAVENRRPSTGRSIHREGSFSSLSSQDVSFPDLYSDNYIHAESQVREMNIRRK